MKIKIKGIIVFSIICFFLIVFARIIFHFIASHFYFYVNENLYHFILTLITIFYLLGLTYGRIWTFNSLKKKRKKIIFILICIIIFLFVFLLFDIKGKTNLLHEYCSTENLGGTKGKVFEIDDKLGYRPIANSFGFQTFPVGEDIPIHFDENGFRTPVNDESRFSKNQKVDIIFFGCSFTYGSGCYAEETFPYIVASRKELNYINAGVPGYGLSQMLILARRLIPKYKPKIVIIQYSPWLIGRSTDIYGPSFLGLVPNPYFTFNGKNYNIQDPAFNAQVFALDREVLKRKYANNYIAFFINVALPFYISDFINYFKVKVKILLSPKLMPAKNQKQVEKLVYIEMVKLINDNGGKAIILNLGDKAYTAKSKNLFEKNMQVDFAEADSLLDNYLSRSASKNFRKEFCIWKFNGKDSVLVDPHPNPNTHEIIATSILLKLK